jgi:hypothetical protein
MEAVAIESKRTIEIDKFVPRDEIDEIFCNSPYYVVPDGEVGAQAFAVIRASGLAYHLGGSDPDSLAAHIIQQSGLVRYKCGHIRILNLEGLLEATCECYETVKSVSDRLIGPVVA